MKVNSKSKKETQRAGVDFVKKINPPQPPFEKGGQGGFLIGLYGDLGAGKTTFVQGMARGLGINPDYYVNSPTFTLVNEYRGKDVCLIHVDLYRIAKPGEAEMLALEEYIRPGNIVVIEWAERLPGFFQELDFEVRFEVISDTERGIEVASPRLRHPSPA